MEMKATTICAVKRNGVTAIAGDGQVTMGQSIVMKGNAKKVKRIYDDKVVVGFAGSVSDAFTLSEKFEEMLQKYSGNLMRSAVELAEVGNNAEVGENGILPFHIQRMVFERVDGVVPFALYDLFGQCEFQHGVRIIRNRAGKVKQTFRPGAFPYMVQAALLRVGLDELLDGRFFFLFFHLVSLCWI